MKNRDTNSCTMYHLDRSKVVFEDQGLNLTSQNQYDGNTLFTDVHDGCKIKEITEDGNIIVISTDAGIGIVETYYNKQIDINNAGAYRIINDFMSIKYGDDAYGMSDTDGWVTFERSNTPAVVTAYLNDYESFLEFKSRIGHNDIEISGYTLRYSDFTMTMALTNLQKFNIDSSISELKLFVNGYLPVGFTKAETEEIVSAFSDMIQSEIQ